jgi:hypothetical protein
MKDYVFGLFNSDIVIVGFFLSATRRLARVFLLLGPVITRFIFSIIDIHYHVKFRFERE